jgi:hypothetical protein
VNALAWLLVQLAFWMWVLYLCVHDWVWILVAGMIAARMTPPLVRKMAARHEAERQRVEQIVRRADEEHRLFQEGDLNGVYGAYQPPTLIRGMGIRLP